MRVDILKPQEVKETKRTRKNKNSYTLHNVSIVDGSSSMDRPKFSAAVEGVNTDFEAAIKSAEKEGVELTLSIFQFASTFNLSNKDNIIMQSPKGFKEYNPKQIGGGTRLYGTVGDVINYLIKNKKQEDRVLMNIFTDGQENATETDSPYKNPKALAELIADAEKNHNFTITFMGTKQDVAYITRTININVTNTLAHNNTAADIQEKYKMRSMSTKSYMANLAADKDVTYDFFQ
jgi:Mg-chelatase subunit ChlD